MKFTTSEVTLAATAADEAAKAYADAQAETAACRAKIESLKGDLQVACSREDRTSIRAQLQVLTDDLEDLGIVEHQKQTAAEAAMAARRSVEQDATIKRCVGHMDAGIPDDLTAITQAAAVLGGALAKLTASREKAHGCYIGKVPGYGPRHDPCKLLLTPELAGEAFMSAVHAAMDGHTERLAEFVAALKTASATADDLMRGKQTWEDVRGKTDKPKPVPISEFRAPILPDITAP